MKAVAIFLGPNGLGRRQALEIRAFVSQCVERALPMIPVLLPSVKEVPGELVFLRELNYVRFESSIEELQTLRGLLWGITGNRPATGMDQPGR